MILSTQLTHLLLRYVFFNVGKRLAICLGRRQAMLSIIGQARAGIQSPALYNFVTVQDFTLFFLKCAYLWKCKKMQFLLTILVFTNAWMGRF